MRAFRDELPSALAAAREAAAAFVGVPADSTALVRNVTEAVGVVLQGLGIGPGDEVVVSNHGYLTAGWSVEARGGTLRTAAFGVDSDPGDVVAAFAAAVTERTRLVVIDQITSPTALVLPVAEVAAAVAPVRSSSTPPTCPARCPGSTSRRSASPSGSATCTSGPTRPGPRPRCGWRPQHREAMRPLVTSWSHGLPFPERFDLQGTVDHSAVGRRARRPRRLAAARRVGAGPAQRRPAPRGAEARAGRARHRRARAAAYRRRPACGSSRCPTGVATTTEDAEALWHRLYAAGFVVPPVAFGGRGLPPPRRRALQRRVRLRAARGRAARGPRRLSDLDAADDRGMWKDRPTAGTCPRGGPAP